MYSKTNLVGQHNDPIDLSQQKIVALACKSQKRFIKEFKTYNEATTKELYLSILTQIEKAVIEGNVIFLSTINKLVDYIIDVKAPISLKEFCEHTENPVKNINLIILACKHDKLNILEYLFSNDSKLLKIISHEIVLNAISSNNKDEAGHNAFYYAISSNNVDLLDELIGKWPNNYFTRHLQQQDELLSTAYEELKLKNILLSQEMEAFVQNKLINARFFSKASAGDSSFKSNRDSIRKRIELVVENINQLNVEYSNNEKVDDRFVFIARFIAKNLHVLKHLLKSTYNRLPWEEIEFCLVTLISSVTEQKEINLFYNIILNKRKILNYLKHFSIKLSNEKDVIKNVKFGKLAELTKLKRNKVVAEIIKNNIEFVELYNDYKQIRDMHCLTKINEHIKLALACDPKKREGQLTIARVLQMMVLPINTRQIVINLRNSLSHAYSLSKRTETKDNNDITFFSNVQNDIKKIDSIVTHGLYEQKVAIIKTLLEKFIKTENLNEIKEVDEIFLNVKLNQIELNNSKNDVQLKLIILMTELYEYVEDKTEFEEKQFNKMNELICFGESNLTLFNYEIGIRMLQSISGTLSDATSIWHSQIRNMKSIAESTLKSIVPDVESENIKEFSRLWVVIAHNVRQKIKCKNNTLTGSKIDKYSIYNAKIRNEEIDRLTSELLFLTEFGTKTVKWIEKFKEMLQESVDCNFLNERAMIDSITEDDYNKQLALNLSELAALLNSSTINHKHNNGTTCNEKNKAAIEVLLLDLMSILDRTERYLENNLLSLDDNAPILIGKCLREYLAHCNPLIDVLPYDSLMAVILNAKTLASGNVTKCNNKIGKLTKDDPTKLKYKYDESLDIITNQNKMFTALEEGDLEKLKDCLKEGADIKARNINMWTSVHFAAKGSNLEIMKFVLDQHLDVNVKNIYGQTPLHIAAAYGGTNTVEYFLKQMHLSVDGKDNFGKTALIMAAKNGHNCTVKVLLMNNANSGLQDFAGYSPLFYAVNNNHIDVVKTLLEKEYNVNTNQAFDGLLHVAAEKGHLELVHLFLENGANVNTKNDDENVPLHMAASNGHLDVVNCLIVTQANINCRALNGCTALHYAIENGHQSVANALLEHGADVNVVDKIFNNTPLHYATYNGHEEIVKTLLIHNADVNIKTVTGTTPLHFAVINQHFTIIDSLIERGAIVCSADSNDETPLHYAAKNGLTKVAELLINKGAVIDPVDCNVSTPIHMAAIEGHKDVADVLIRHKAATGYRDNKGMTPLHLATMRANNDIIDLLVYNKAEVNAAANRGETPLHIAASRGHIDTLVLLIVNKADVNASDIYNFTPLHMAVRESNNDCADILIRNHAQVNARAVSYSTHPQVATSKGIYTRNLTPLLLAVSLNNTEIVKLLIANGADVNADGKCCLLLAIRSGCKDIVEILLRNDISVEIKDNLNCTPLHLAAQKGDKHMTNLLLKRGADVNAGADFNITPLLLAVQGGYEEIVKILIEKGSQINSQSYEGFTPLHIAAVYGHEHIVKVLLKNKVKVCIKDYNMRTPLECAVGNGHLNVVKLLLQNKNVDINTKGERGVTILHIAAQEGYLNIVEYLTNKGSNINATNIWGSKPIHAAVREGHKNIVEFFLRIGVNINDLGADNKSLLYYASERSHLEIVKYLIKEGADIDFKNIYGKTPMHIAAACGCNNIINILLKNGASYDVVDNISDTPLKLATDTRVFNLLSSTDQLFKAVNRNNCSEVENHIKNGASVNAKNTKNVTSLYYAAWKGYEDIVDILLRNNANPNIVNNTGFSPLHYAVKFSHIKIIKALFSKGAIYNAASDNGKTPLDLAEDVPIRNLFELLDEFFKNIKDGNLKIIDDLNKLDEDTIKAIMKVHNTENKTLVAAAIHNNFSKVELLKGILQEGASAHITEASTLFNHGDYRSALSIYTSVFEKRKEILGADNPGTLEIQRNLAETLYKQGDYQNALNQLEEIFQKQRNILGSNNKDVLKTRSLIALVMHRQGRDEDAMNIYQDVYQKQLEILGPNHVETLGTEFNMALVLNNLCKHEEALNINKRHFKIYQRQLGAKHGATVNAQNNIAVVLASLGKYDIALKVYNEVYEKKKIIFGVNHVDTLRTRFNIAGIYLSQEKFDEALDAHKEILGIQKNVLGNNHPETLTTQYNLANVLFLQAKWTSALKVYKGTVKQMKAVYGPDCPSVLDMLKKIDAIDFKRKLDDSNITETRQYLPNDINVSGISGYNQGVKHSLKDVNNKEIVGVTPLYYDINKRHMKLMSLLMKKGNDVTEGTVIVDDDE